MPVIFTLLDKREREKKREKEKQNILSIGNVSRDQDRFQVIPKLLS